MCAILQLVSAPLNPIFDQCELLAVVDVARDLRVDFLRLAPSRDFETSSRAVKKL